VLLVLKVPISSPAVMSEKQFLFLYILKYPIPAAITYPETLTKVKLLCILDIKIKRS
jgi:hypothetical protein